ncbi:MAG: hypothetical protein KDD61_16355, partial [Bdellovibrionales bacterium]|nr:hypothetical protein [Bdellovibrionales bacterium]
MKMKVLTIGFFALFMSTAQAQFGFSAGVNAGVWGSGAWGGMQSCPYDVSSGYSDEYMDLKSDESDLKAELRDLKKELRDVQKDVGEAEKKINEGLRSEVAVAVMDHLQDTTRGPNSYADSCQSGGSADVTAGPTEPQVPLPFMGNQSANSTASSFSGPLIVTNANFFCINYGESTSHAPLAMDVWKRHIARNGGTVNKDVCSQAYFTNGSPQASSISKCKRGIDAYKRAYAEQREKEERMAEIQDELDRIKSELREEKREMRRAERDGETEGGFCLFCAQSSRRRKQSNFETFGNIALGALGSVLQYRTAKDAIHTAGRLGWPMTAPYAAFGGSPWPYAVGGALSMFGGINGGYGCSPMMGGGGMYGGGPFGMMNPYGMMGGGGMYGNMGGAFGYPGGWGSPFGNMGGGMYAPGMGPWGMAGPWGLGGGMMSPFMGGMNPYLAGGMMNPMGMMGMSPYGMSPFGGGMGGMNPFGMGGMGGPFGGMGGMGG